MNIRARLTFRFILLTVGIFATALFFVQSRFAQHVEVEYFSFLENKARLTAEMALSHEDELRPVSLPGTHEVLDLAPAENTVIFDKNARCIFALDPTVPFLDGETMSGLIERGAGRIRRADFFIMAFTMVSQSGGSYFVAAKGSPDFSKLDELRNILLLTFLLTLAAVATGGWFYAGQALRPVSRIVEAVDGMLPADLSRRLPADNQHDELGHLAATFNRLLDRIERAFLLQKSFISNVSHELKNPLAAMDAQLQLARAKPRPAAEYEATIDSIHDDVRELADTSDKLLQLAKVNSDPQGVQFTEVRLDELLYQARAAVLKTRPGATVLIEFTDLPDDPDQLCARGNEPLLRTALLNLLDNGCKFSDGNRVDATISFDEKGRPMIAIHNDGPPIPEEELPRVFEPFFRSSKDISKKGSGIGLSLVQNILRLHGAEVSVASSAGEGTTFLVKFFKKERG